MTKIEMIKELVKAWVLNAPDQETLKNRFIDHESVENALNKKWAKEQIERLMKWLKEGKNIDVLIDEYAIEPLC